MPQGEGVWLLARGWINTFKTLREASKFPETLKFLIAYFFYSDSYSTMVTVGVLIFQDILCMSSLTLGLVILEVMIVAVFGNFLALHIQVCTGGGRGISRVGVVVGVGVQGGGGGNV